MRESSYLAVPAGAGDGPWPGVVVLHDALGFRRDVRDQADRFAERGYLALAPNLYAHGRGLMCLLATYRARSRDGAWHSNSSIPRGGRWQHAWTALAGLG